MAKQTIQKTKSQSMFVCENRPLGCARVFADAEKRTSTSVSFGGRYLVMAEALKRAHVFVASVVYMMKIRGFGAFSVICLSFQKIFSPKIFKISRFI